MPCIAGGQCSANALPWQIFTSSNFIISVNSGSGGFTDDPTNNRWNIAGASSLVARLTPVGAFSFDQLVQIGTCQVLAIDVRSPSGVSLFSGNPQTCGSGLSTPINAPVGYVLISGFSNGATALNYDFYNYTGSLSASAFWQNFRGQYEAA